jgi:hypothetical protein
LKGPLTLAEKTVFAVLMEPYPIQVEVICSEVGARDEKVPSAVFIDAAVKELTEDPSP